MIVIAWLGKRESQIPAPITSSSGCAAISTTRCSGSIAADHLCAEFRELLDALRRTCMVRLDAAAFRRETECDGHVKLFESVHLPIEPFLCIRAQAVGPTEAGAEVFNAQLPQPSHSVLEPVILEMEPLADT